MPRINYKGRILGLLIIAFITTNGLLLFLDEGEKVDRKSYIHTWSKTITYDLLEKFETKGVFTAQEKAPIYFNGNNGTFDEFLIQEGDKVDEGDALYTYNVANYTQQENELESEIGRIEEEIDAIEEYIDEIESYQIPEPETESSNRSNIFGQNDESEETPPSYVETEYLQQEEIAEQEAELNKQESLLEMAEDQLDQLQEDGDQITVTSSFSGVVTNLSEELNDPLITMESTSLIVKAEVREDERNRLSENMAAKVKGEDFNFETTGTLTDVHQFPEEIGLNKTSRYPFTVSLDDIDEEVLPGYHANVEVTTKEALGAITALQEALITDENLYAWVMNKEGNLERRAIQSGLETDGLIEIVEGLEAGEWLAVHPKDEFRNGAVFFTPLHIDDLDVRQMFKIKKSSILNYSLLGFLSR
ncbi:efflux RND transporter periplasmic adaptor subunit [Halobacillus litoralis]|uniref:efflux RND transporter periplasmic adaptor subunit n=1 Tax=Halobacillus litoralis TaxID=45668 RepID=UPI001CFD8E33|nr:efflux RND transporter periplasmic adaptor subunit [Halobacillus litoralis]